jgi:hypothetical protein
MPSNNAYKITSNYSLNKQTIYNPAAIASFGMHLGRNRQNVEFYYNGSKKTRNSKYI